MRRLTFENVKGESVVFYHSPFFIESLTGIGELDTDTQSQKSPYQDGDTYIDSILQPRFTTLEGSINSRDLSTIKQYRKHLLRVCNPKLGLGKITLEMDGDKKEIMAVPDGVPFLPERGDNVYQKFLITWKCPNPYWRDPNQTSKPLVAYTGGFTLPFTLPFTLGRSGSRTVLYNAGDVPAPVQIEIHGPTTNPQIINRTTGEYIRINRSIADDEVLCINTASGRQRVEIKRGDEIIPAFGFLDHNGTLTGFTLELGENEIEHIADAGDRNAVVTVTWQSMYVGI